MPENKKILLIAYHYHPDLQVGAQRTIKYVKYLPKFGWDPHVLTVDPKYYPQRDEAPLGYECPVYRTGKWPVPDDWYKWIKNLVSGSGPKGNSGGQGTGSAKVTMAEKSTPFVKKLLNSLSQTPDNFSGWYLPAAFAAWRLIRKHRFDAIYTSGPPQTCHMVGYTAHRLTGVPLVIDFRDPWLYPKARDNHLLRFSKRFDEKYQAKALRDAALVITTTDEWRDHLKELYHPHLDQKCHTIVNGFDEDDFNTGETVDPKLPGGKITFLYAGNLYAGRDPSAMLQAAGELLTEGEIAPDDFAFDFYGNWDIDMTNLDQIISRGNLDGIVNFKPPVKRTDYLALLKRADVLILIQAPQGRVHIPAKAFEYLGTGNEILTLTSEGATKNFMSRFEHVFIADLSDKNDIKNRLREVIKRVRNRDKGSATAQGLESITRGKLTEEFAGLLNRAIPPKK